MAAPSRSPERCRTPRRQELQCKRPVLEGSLVPLKVVDHVASLGVMLVQPMTEIQLNSRILFLSDDPEVVERQLQGENLALVEAGALRDSISTDEITPATVGTVWD
jgi:hypothetical protein